MKNNQSTRVRSLLAGAPLLGMLLVGQAVAVPSLQLDIVSDATSYDATETIVTSSDTFTLYAYRNISGLDADDLAAVLADTFYVSVAVTPKIDTPDDIGSFEVEGASKTTADMAYGRPPVDAALDAGLPVGPGGSLAPHDIFDTFFLELEFQFDGADTTGLYNTQDAPGTGPTLPGDNMLYRAFEFDVSALLDEYDLHFDLYNTAVKYFKKGDTIKIDDFAPFSHDAGTTSVTPPPPVEAPEPLPVALLAIALSMLAAARVYRIQK